MATRKLQANGFTLISNKEKAGGMRLGERIGYEMMHAGYSTIAQNDVGYLPAKIMEYRRLAKAFQKVPDTDASAFNLFRNTLAAVAEGERPALPGGGSKAPVPIGSGSTFTGFYDDLREGQESVADKFSNKIGSSPEKRLARDKKLSLDNVDFNDPKSVKKFKERLDEYAKETPLIANLGHNAAEFPTGHQELLILMHVADQKAYTKYINTFEEQIKDNFNKELKGLQDYAKSIGYTGDIKNVKQLKKFAATLPTRKTDAFLKSLSPEQMELFKQMPNGIPHWYSSDRRWHKLKRTLTKEQTKLCKEMLYTPAITEEIKKMDDLIEATAGKKKVDKYILARINSGEIDINKILTTGEFNGIKLDEESMAAFRALAVYANSDQISIRHQNDLLEKFGVSPQSIDIDLNSLTDVSARVKDLEKALDKAGYGFAPGHFGLGVPLGNLSLDQLKKIDISNLSDDAQKLFKEYISMREHQGQLLKKEQAKKQKRASAVQVVIKTLGDSDLAHGISQVRSIKRNAQSGWHVFQQSIAIARMTGRIARRGLHALDQAIRRIPVLGRPYDAVRNLMTNNANRIKNALKTITNKIPSPIKNAPRNIVKGAKKVVTAPKRGFQKAKKAIKNKIEKHMPAKWRQKRLLKKAGKHNNKLVKLFKKIAQKLQHAKAVVMKYIVIGILILLLIDLVLTLAASFLTMIAEMGRSIDDSWIGDAANWIKDNFAWPWNASEAKKKSTFNGLILQLLEQDVNAKDIDQQLSTAGTFHSGIQLNYSNAKDLPTDDNEKKKAWTRTEFKADSSNATESNTYFMFLDKFDEGVAITEYSTVKLVMSMMHTYTYDITSKKDLEKSIYYAQGLWDYFNDTTLEVLLQFCDKDEGGGRKLSYSCSSSKLYTSLDGKTIHYVTDAELANGIKINPDTPETLYIIEGNLYKARNANGSWKTITNSNGLYSGSPGGCIHFSYSAYDGTGIISTYDYKKGEWKSAKNNSPNCKLVNLYDISNDFKTKYDSDWNAFYCTTSYKTETGEYFKYKAKPVLNAQCTLDYSYLFANTTINIDALLREIKYCTSATDIIHCTNKDSLVYKTVAIDKWVWDSDATHTIHTATGNKEYQHWRDSFISDASDSVVYYKCSGHESPVFCSNKSIAVVALKPNTATGRLELNSPVGHETHVLEESDLEFCSNYKTVEGYYLYTDWQKYDNREVNMISPTTYYICLGHDSHPDHDATSPYYAQCDNHTRTTGYYNCQRNEPEIREYTATFCFGHIPCDNNHWDCTGHEFTYCEGHVAYTIKRRIINSESDSIYNEGWSFEVEKGIWLFSSKTTYSPKKDAPDGMKSLARSDWKGWTDSNKQMMKETYMTDWAQRYSVGLTELVKKEGAMTTLVGAKISTFETLKLSDIFGLDSATGYLEDYIYAAYSATGRIPYFPGDKAAFGGLNEDNNFNVPANKDEWQWDENNTLLGVHGLDSAFFADWIYQSTHPGAKHIYLHSYDGLQTLCTSAYVGTTVDTATPPGSLIVSRTLTSKGEWRYLTGVLLGFVDNGNYIVYMGYDSTNWVTVVIEPNRDQWHTHKDFTKTS